MESLFPEFEENKSRKTQLGHTAIEYNNVSSILTPASGFMADYDYTLNPYSGCSFGCSYCYAAFFARSTEKRDSWGRWLIVKENALQLLTKFRKKPLINKIIYMSSVTDPYQPIEKDLELTRSILKELLDFHDVKLIIQTRSPLVTRDIDILKKFSDLQVNMTISTDSEKVRRIFEPHCTNNFKRLDAISQVCNENIKSCITMTPLLPIEDAEKFADILLKTGVKKFIIQPFHPDKGKFVAGTREEAKTLMNEMNWNLDRYYEVEQILLNKIPNLGIGKEGFKPD